MADPKRPEQAPEPAKRPAFTFLGYLGLLLGFGAVALTVDSGSVTVLGFSFSWPVPAIAAVAFVGGLLAARFGPTRGNL
ncbi:hypothetical protein [Demequina iriomotensis]|uniref:hypothetical protein n=1 Tax=Demequina iriomotensis TaxID=1536641 RepID=UPI0007827294|nr:hypothetical protein [Demequina iriomotensis]